MLREQFELPLNQKAYDDGFYEFRGLQIAIGEGVCAEAYGIDVFFENMLLFVKEKINSLEGLTIIDMCAGSGMLGIAMAIEFTNSVVYGVEKYEKPFFWTTKNADGFKEQINKSNSKFIPVMCSALDSIDNLKHLHSQVDFILAGYPCIPIPDDLSKVDTLPYDLTSVVGGEDGLDVIKEVLAASSILLKKGGVLVTTTPVRMFKHVEPLLDDSVWSETFESPLEFMVTVKK